MNTEEEITVKAATEGAETMSSVPLTSTPAKSQTTTNAVQMTPREIVMAKKEAKLKEEQDNLTFKPKINNELSKKNTQESASNTQSVFTKLHTNAKKIPDREPSPTHSVATLSPQVLATSVNRLYSGVGARVRSPKVEESEKQESVKVKKVTKEVLSESAMRLHKEAEKLKAKREEKKKEEDEALKKEFTFKPQLNSKHYSPRKDTTETSTIESMSYDERLQKYAADKARRMEEAKKAREESELKGCSFKPALNPRSSTGAASPPGGGSARKPVPSTDDKECTFKPQLATSSRKSNSNISTTPGVSVHERLFKEGSATIKEFEEQRQKLLEEEVQKTCTFAPQLPAKKSTETHSESDVFTRLNQIRKKDLSEIKESMELSACSFHPEISEMAEHVRTEGEVHERLNSLAEILRREAKAREELKVQNELKGATFSPEIPVISEVLARKRMERSGSPDHTESIAPKSLVEEGVFDDHDQSTLSTGAESPNGKPSATVSTPCTPAASAIDLSIVGSAMRIYPSPQQEISSAAASNQTTPVKEPELVVVGSRMKILSSSDNVGVDSNAEQSPAAISELLTPTSSVEVQESSITTESLEANATVE